MSLCIYFFSIYLRKRKKKYGPNPLNWRHSVQGDKTKMRLRKPSDPTPKLNALYSSAGWPSPFFPHPSTCPFRALTCSAERSWEVAIYNSSLQSGRFYGRYTRSRLASFLSDAEPVPFNRLVVGATATRRWNSTCLTAAARKPVRRTGFDKQWNWFDEWKTTVSPSDLDRAGLNEA